MNKKMCIRDRCKVYSVDQHAMIPDVLIMSEKVWKQISPEDQEIILELSIIHISCPRPTPSTLP